MSIQVFGMPVSRGVAIGRAVLVASSRVDVAHYFVSPDRVEFEIDRMRHARDTVAAELTTLQRDLPDEAPAELSALLDVHLMLLRDEALTGATKQWQWPYRAEKGSFEPTGARTLMFKGQLTGSHVFGISPDGRHFLYWKDEKIQSYNLDTARTQTLGGPKAVSFTDMEFDRPGPKPPYGIAGFTPDGSTESGQRVLAG